MQHIETRLYELLGHGVQSAVPAAKLAEMLGHTDTRTIRKLIERERTKGAIILSDENGYYMPSENIDEAAQELTQYIRKVDARCRTNRITSRSAKSELKKLLHSEITGQGNLFDGNKHCNY